MKVVLSGLVVLFLCGPALAGDSCVNPPKPKHVWLRGGAQVLAGMGGFTGGILIGKPQTRLQAVRQIAAIAAQKRELTNFLATRLVTRHLIPSLVLALVEGAALLATLDGLVYLFSGGTRHLIGSIAGHNSEQTCQNISALYEDLAETAAQLEVL